MNVESQFYRFLKVTGSAEAAATLVLAAAQSSTLSDGLLPLADAAELLGYKPAGLRKLAKQGAIRYVQNGRGPIKFHKDWIDEFLQSNNPSGVKRSPARRQIPHRGSSVAGFNPTLFKA